MHATTLVPGLLAVTLATGLALASTDHDADGVTDASTVETGVAALDGLTPAALRSEISRQETEMAALRARAVQSANLARDLTWELARDGEDISLFLATAQKLRPGSGTGPGLHPSGPLAAARAAGMLRVLNPAVEAGADRLNARLEAIDEARRGRDEGLADLAAGLERLDAARQTMIERMTFVSASLPATDAVMRRALAEAGTIEELVAQTVRNSAVKRGPDGAANQNLIWPAEGVVSEGFNSVGMGGTHRRGIELSAWPMSLVVAPADGRIRYAGPFLDYGNIVVIEGDGGLTAVLAGLSRLTVSGGSGIAKGAVVGILGGRSPDIQDYVRFRDQEATSGLRETLYLEIRHGQKPVDPVPLLTGENG